MGFTLEKTALKHLLGDGSFLIPTYQRPYSWNENNIKILFEDIFNSYSNGESYYFIGNIVLWKGSCSDDKEGFEIIDGQQRLI